MTGVALRIEVDVASVVEGLKAIGVKLEPREALAAIANRQVKWIDDNFRATGTDKAWQPLKPNTVAKRIGGSSAILQDKGRLRQSYIAGQPVELTTEEVTIGSNVHYARYHQQGTKPYTILPKGLNFFAYRPGVKSSLAFPVAQNTSKNPKAGVTERAGGSWRGGRLFMRVSRVHHPGVPARPMLPSLAVAARIAKETMTAILELEIRRVGGNR